MARRINLVPQSERARTTTNVGMLGLVAAAIIVIFAVGLAYYMLTGSLDERRTELAELEQETQVLQTQVAALNKYESLKVDREAAESTVREIYAGRTLVSDILNSLSLVMPENVWLKELDLTTANPGLGATATEPLVDNTLSMSGMTYSFEDVAQLLVRLQLIDVLDRIDLQSAAETGEGADIGTEVKDFSINAIVSPPSEEAELPVSQVEVEGL